MTEIDRYQPKQKRKKKYNNLTQSENIKKTQKSFNKEMYNTK